MPVATSLTRGSEQSTPCSSASAAPAQAATRTPTQGELLSKAPPKPAIAESTSTPSRPRLMRPDFSVRHSPRLTNRNGTPTRKAPPTMAAMKAIEVSDMAGSGELFRGDGVGRTCAAAQLLADCAPVDRAQGFACQNQHEGDTLQHLHRRIGQAEAALQQAACGTEATKQDRDRNDRERRLASDERDQNSRVAIARDQRGIGVGVDRRDLDRASQAGTGAAGRAREQNEPAGRQADKLGRARIAAD